MRLAQRTHSQQSANAHRREVSQKYGTAYYTHIPVLLLALLLPLIPKAVAQSPAQAATATELPVIPWGIFARSHSGPSFLANRVLSQQFSFPIVVGQRREEIATLRQPGEDKKMLPRPMRVTLERRAIGLSPLQAENDDRLPSPLAPLPNLGEGRPQVLDSPFPQNWEKGVGGMRAANRRAHILEANADSLLWRYQIVFAPADFIQPLLPPAAPQTPPSRWTPGEANVTLLPVNAESVGDGLLIRVTLTNRSDALQTYCVDVLGGMGAVAPAFLSDDLTIAGTENGLIVRHARREEITFGIIGSTGPFPLRFYHVGDDYFAANAEPRTRQADGRILPPAILPLLQEGMPEKKEKGKGKKNEPEKKKQEIENSANQKPGAGWALARADEIKVAPGKSVTVTFCVGIGRNSENALEVADTLLSLADDVQPIGKPLREGAVTLAQRLHDKVRFASGDAALDRLMAQSLINVPNHNLRRVGVASRQIEAVYQPEPGGYIALGWTFYRPDWAAAQLNAHFLTRLDPEKPIENPQAISPINLFALWELYQKSQDRALLDQFYLHARRRYQELLQAGRLKPDDWLFVWPDDAMRPRKMAMNHGEHGGTRGEDILTTENTERHGEWKEGREHAALRTQNSELCLLPSSVSLCLSGALSLFPPVPAYAPDYSAYVIRAAKVMRLIAEEARRPPEEMQEYDRDAQKAAEALNKTLWNAERRQFLPAPTAPGETDPLRADALDNLLPLLAGRSVLTPEQSAALVAELRDLNTFWSDFGLRSFSKTSPHYQPDKPGRGAVRFGQNYLLWRALLDMGETAIAQKLAENLLRAYRTAQEKTDGCPERLNGDTGAASGATDYSGDACALIALHAAYFMPGTVSTGWDIHLLTKEYDAKSSALRIVFRAQEISGKGAILCALGKPNARYQLKQGAQQTTVTADASGVVTLTAPPDRTIQQCILTPDN